MSRKTITFTTIFSLTAYAKAQCPMTLPLCGERSTLCPHKRCTRPDGKCNKKGDGCLDIRWNRDYCVDPANKCGDGFCGTPPGFSDCYCENETCIVRGQNEDNATARDDSMFSAKECSSSGSR